MSCIQQSLRAQAVQQDAEAAESFCLSQLWQQLSAGAWVFNDTFSSEERHFAIVRRSPVAVPRPVDARKLRLLESVLLGKSPKVVAIEQARCLSSITASIQECVRSMGITVRVSQASALLTMAARALHRPNSSPTLGRISELSNDDGAFIVISALRPDLRLPVELSLAEAAVLRRLVQGDTYAQISSQRATSPRTVANQLATAFRKLGVSGRRATLQCLIQHSAILD